MMPRPISLPQSIVFLLAALLCTYGSIGFVAQRGSGGKSRNWWTQMMTGTSPFEQANAAKYAILHTLSTASTIVLSTSTRNSIDRKFSDSPSFLRSSNNDKVRIQLEEYDSVYCLNYTVNGNMFRAIVDTGSPFLIVPSVCSRAWGCAPRNAIYEGTGLEDTVEIFGGQDYDTQWRRGTLQLARQVFPYYTLPQPGIVFAEVGLDVLRPPGGVFFGLIRDRSARIRPTLLEQLGYTSIRFDAKNKELTLSRKPQIPRYIRSGGAAAATSSSSSSGSDKRMKLVDLRALGDPVCHYAVKVKSLEINNVRIGNDDMTIYGIFDTGCTGCVLSDDLFNDENTPNPPRKVRLVVEAESGREEDDVVIEAVATRQRLFIVTSANIKWFKGNNTASSSSSSSESHIPVDEDKEAEDGAKSRTTKSNTRTAVRTSTPLLDTITSASDLIDPDEIPLDLKSNNKNSNNPDDGTNTRIDVNSYAWKRDVIGNAKLSSASSSDRPTNNQQQDVYASHFQQLRDESSSSSSSGTSTTSSSSGSSSSSRPVSKELSKSIQVVVMGLTFFHDKVLTIDIDDKRVTLESPT